jgi:AcrR family transcriptional regulator
MGRMGASVTKELQGIRGSPEHEVRDRIVAAAEARFQHYGFNKTTVADIAGDLGISTAYIYKFYASKLAICEAILGEIVERIDTALEDVVALDESAAARLRKLYLVLLDRSQALYFSDRKLHDMIRAGMDQRWQVIERHKARMRAAAQAIVEDGRERGEFETRTPITDVVDAIWISMVPFAHPSVLEHLSEVLDLKQHARHMADFALRGLAKA